MYSVIIPVYNVEKYLDECLHSISSLNSPDYEIIAVNDGSTDNSAAILNEWEKRLPNLVVINQENRGLSAARNTGLKFSKGEYIAFIDSDDYVDANAMHQLLETARHNNTDICVGDFKVFNDGDNSGFQRKSIPANEGFYIGESFFVDYHKWLLSVVWRNIYKRDFLINNSLFFHEGVYFEDVEFTPIVFQQAENIFYSSNAFYLYRKRVNSITTSDTSLKKTLDALSIWETLEKYISSDRNISKKCKAVFCEMGFHCFIKNFVRRNQPIDNTLYHSLQNLGYGKMNSFRYSVIYSLFKLLPQELFLRIFKTLCN